MAKWTVMHYSQSNQQISNHGKIEETSRMQQEEYDFQESFLSIWSDRL